MFDGGMHDCRLILDTGSPGPWNMAVDEFLLEWCGRTGACCWRFYGWSEPTLSLGYFQTYSDRWQHAASRHAPVVRRASGGGAILHDDELTYSLAVPLEHPLGRRRLELYRAVHTTLIEVLADRGIRADLWQDDPTGRQPQPFLCFQRRSSGDVVFGTAKVAGSAQRRSAAAVLQHGSILLRRSPAAPELDGLSDLTGETLAASSLATAWLPRLAGRLELDWHEFPLETDELQSVDLLVAGKYGTDRWNCYRGRG